MRRGNTENTHTHTHIYTTKPTSAQNEQKAQRELTAQASKALISAQDSSEARPGDFAVHFLHATTPSVSNPSTQFVTVC